MFKDFDNWNILKKEIEVLNKELFCKTRDIWWCSLGINTGSETCGKNTSYERPVLVMHVFRKNLILVVPLTSKNRDVPYRLEINYKNRISYAMIDQIKSISTKRLNRKVCRIESGLFDEVLSSIKFNIKFFL